MMKKPFHEIVAEQLIEQLKAGTAPWQRPWEPGQPGALLPINLATGKRYRGINVLNLMAQGRGDSRWLTYRQAAEMGAQVRRGEKGTTIQYWKFNEEQAGRDDNGQPVLDATGQPVKEVVRLERPSVFFSTVFNAEQIDGLPPRQVVPESWNAIERAEQILQASGATILHSSGQGAFYRPATDSIMMPDRARFASADAYYVTALHELGHWTGHESRLNRDLAHPFGSVGYAKEELRAEIASMILSDTLGIGRDPGQHAAYVESWIEVLEKDPLEIFRAAADAEKIHGYVMAFEQQLQTQQDTVTVIDQAEAKMQVIDEMKAQVQVPQAGRDAEANAQQKPTARQYIDVPFREKNEVKALGARWDRRAQSWYVPSGLDAAQFARWLDASGAAPAPEAATKALSDRVYLAVPYGEREAAKVAGALWDKAAKSWYAGPQADMTRLERWRPENVANQQSPAQTPREEFAEALRSASCLVDGEHPIMDGKTHRITVEGDKSKEASGFYVGHVDGHPAGYIKNNRTGVEMRWKSKGYSLDPVEKAKLQADAAAKLAERAAERERLHEATAQRVSQQAQNLLPVVSKTPYMKAKGIHAHVGLLTDAEGQKTYVPAFDANGKQWTMQYIQEDGTKRFAKNSRKEGCFHPIGGMNALAASPVIIIAEGYATAATVAEALDSPAVVAFDSGNLLAVARVLHDKFPDKPIIVAGDDDRHQAITQGTNPGRTKAEEAAKAVGGTAVFPIFAPGENEYSSGLPAITPQSYREHERASRRLASAQTDADTVPLSQQESADLNRALLNPEQLAALAKMKAHTDFNDLAMRSTLGQSLVTRQLRTAIIAMQWQQGKRVQTLEPRRIANIR